ncbi:hypothetical protein HDV05_001108 [Chytridiales sp. JEL 0842]|nr:hypothetical protein HDV05_001108 [Chytridiales sp. JEL 0842]
MQAWIYSQYGSAMQVLSLGTIDRPTPKDSQIQVQVKAVSLNSSDVEYLNCSQPYVKVLNGFSAPRFRVLGSDISGVVTAVGSKVTNFKVGDEVLGDSFDIFGGLAEYAVIEESQTTMKPATISFTQAACIPQAGVLALQSIRDTLKMKQGESILINGAGGGSGSFAIQFAKSIGCTVTGIDRGSKLESMSTWGADHTIDYTTTDYTTQGKKYDAILDFVARRSLFEHKKCLTPVGRYALVGGDMSKILASAFIGPLSCLGSKQSAGVMVHKQNAVDMAEVVRTVEAGQIDIKVDRVFTFQEANKAMERLEKCEANGKVVVSLEA